MVKIFFKDNILSFGQNFLKRQYGLNRIVFWSKFSIKTIWDEPYSLLIKIFQKDYFLPYPDFNSSVRSNFPRQYGSCADKTVQVFQMDNTVQRDSTGWNNSSKRKDLFVGFCELYDQQYCKIIKFHSVRCLGILTCIERVLRLLPSLKSYFESLDPEMKNGVEIKSRINR